MANTTQDVELRIRATNYSKKTTTEVVDALKDLTKAQEAQQKAAEKSEASVSDLEKSYQRMESAVKALLGQQSIIKLYEAQQKALADVETRLEAARKAQQEYISGIDPAAKKTAAQTKELNRLAKEVVSAEKEFARAQNRITATGERLAAFGITAGNMADKQREIVTAVQAANVALAAQEDAIEAVDARRAAALQQQRAEADQREKLAAINSRIALAQQAEKQRLDAERVAHAANTKAVTDEQAAKLQSLNATIQLSRQRAEETERINKQTAAIQAQAAAVRKAADAAERQMRAAGVAARGETPVAVSNVAGTIRDISAPAQAALRTVTGLETAVASLEKRVESLSGPVKDYKGALRDAATAQEALQKLAGNVDSYNRQLAAVRAARAEYVASRAAVAQLVAEMRSGAAGDDITTRLRSAQNTLDRAAEALGNITTQARNSRQALREAGVNTQNMANAEAALVQQATRASSALSTITAQFQKCGAAADKAGKSIFTWFGGGDGGRTTLSYMQRMRGELLGLAAGFVGVNAAIELGRRTLEAYQINQAIMSRLTIANGGDARKAGEDFRYLQEQADRIGFSFGKVAPSFAKFSIAAQAAGFSTQEIRFAFEQIAGSAVKARLSTEDFEGVMRAFEQIVSKGKVQAEELRGQLGDRLPGAFQIAAKAAGVTVEEYTKMMELGQVGSEQVINIARELGKTYGAAQAGAETLLQAQARFDNALNRFLTSVAEGGFVESFQGLLNTLTDFINSGQADKLAKGLAVGFSAVVKMIGLVVDNFEVLKTVIVAILGLKFIGWLTTLPTMFTALIAPLTAVNGLLLGLQANMARATAATALAAALGPTGLTGVLVKLAPALIAVGNGLLFIARALPVIGAAVAAYQITSAIMDKIDDSARAKVVKTIKDTEKAVADADNAARALQDARGTAREKDAQAHYDRMREIAVKAIKAQQRVVEKAKEEGLDLTDVTKALPRSAAAGTEDPGDLRSDERRVKQLKEELAKEDKKLSEEMKNQRLKSAKEELDARLKIIDEEFEQKREAARKTIKGEKELNEALAAINKTAANAAAVERAKYNNEQHKVAVAAGERRVKLAQEIALALKEIEDDLEKRATEIDVTKPFEERRKARIEAIGHAYDELYKKIIKQQAVDPKAAAAAKAQLDSFVKQRKELENINANRDEANRLLGEFNKAQTIQQNNLAAINAQQEQGLITAEQAREARNAEIAETGPAIEAAGKRAMEFAESVRALLDPVRYSEIISSVTVGLSKHATDAQTAANNILATQQQINALLAQEEAARQAVQDQRAAGLISSEQEVEALNAITLRYGIQIQTLAEQLLNFVKIAREAGGMSKEQLDAIQASAERMVFSIQNAKSAASELDKVFVNSVLNNGVEAIDALGQSIAKVALGQESLADGFKAAGQAAAQFFAQLLRDLALAIIRTQILKALQAFGGGVGAAAGAMAAGAQHGGGVTGFSSTFTRRVDPAIFAMAPRYHDGGIAGFKPNEVPAVLEKNEEVLTRDDPRHVLNGGAGGAAAGLRVVLVDDRSRIPEAMASSEGEKVTIQNIRANIPTIKQMLGVR